MVHSSAYRRCVNALRRKRAPKNRYKRVERECRNSPCWPPVGDVTYAKADAGAAADASADLPAAASVGGDKQQPGGDDDAAVNIRY